MPRIPALIMTPHSSDFVPFNILADMLGVVATHVDTSQWQIDYLFNQSDPYTDALFYCEQASHVHANISRFVVDLNRRRDEGGLNGVIKLTDFDGRPLYKDEFRFSEKRIEERLRRFYDPYHETLDRMMAKSDIKFFIDGHAMSAIGPIIGPDSGKARPAFSLITGGNAEGEAFNDFEPTSIPADLAQELRDLLLKHFSDIMRDSELENSVLINQPFAKGGTIERLSSPFYAHRKPGFGLEFNRALYLQKGREFDEPISERIGLLNARFQIFMQDCAKTFAARDAFF